MSSSGVSMTLPLPPGPGLTLSWIRCSASISRRRSSAKAGRARVAPQPFQPRAVGAFDAHAGVEREAAPVFPVCHRLGVLRLKHPTAGQRAQQTPADPGLHFRCIERGQNHARESRIRDTSGTRVRHGLGRVRPGGHLRRVRARWPDASARCDSARCVRAGGGDGWRCARWRTQRLRRAWAS